jgi:hypothetical protein
MGVIGRMTQNQSDTSENAGGGAMQAIEKATVSFHEPTALARAWKADVNVHLPYGRLVLVALATLSDGGRDPTDDRKAIVDELGGMTGLQAWKVVEVVRGLLRDGQLIEDGAQLLVA